MQMNSQFRSLQQKLQNTIFELQSDEILKLMRNDESLYQQKVQRIRQIINEELSLEPTVEALMNQNAELKNIIARSEQLMNQSRSQYVKDLQKIDIQFQQLRAEKEQEKKQLHAGYRIKISRLESLNTQTQNQIQALKVEMAKLKAEKQRLSQDKAALQEIRESAEEELQKLRRQLASRTRELELKSMEIDERGDFDRSEYQEVIGKMQQDMFVIRQSWQRKCQEVQSQLREENNQLAISYEQKMRKELKEHAEALKLGNNVVINDSQDIIARRVERIQQDFNDRIQKVQAQMDSLSEVYHSTKEQLETKEKLIKDQKGKINQYQLELQTVRKEMDIKANSLNMEIDSVKVQKNKVDKEVKNLRKQLEQTQKTRQEAKAELSSTSKKLNTLTLEHQKLEEQSNLLKNKLSTLNLTQQQAIKLNTQHQLSLQQKDQTISSQGSQISNLKRNIQTLQKDIESERRTYEVLSRSTKQLKEKMKKIVSLVDRLHVWIRKLKKQNEVMKEDINGRFAMLQGKWKIQSSQLLDQFVHFKEVTQRKYKSKMSELIDELDVKQKQLIDNLEQEKEQLKSSLVQKEEFMKQMEEEMKKYKVRLSGSELQKKQIVEELEREKLTIIRFEQKLDHNEQLYHNTVSKLQKDIGRSLAAFHSRWAENIIQLQNQLDTKDGQIKICIQNIDELSAEVEEQRQRRERCEEEVKKYKKKCEHLKAEREEEVSSYIKRFQQESKHRINLERQLKEVRLSLMKGVTNNSISNFSFNEKEQVPFTNYKQPSNDREKELSEIKQMIARTQKAFVEEPSAERDITRHVSKKHLF